MMTSCSHIEPESNKAPRLFSRGKGVKITQ